MKITPFAVSAVTALMGAAAVTSLAVSPSQAMSPRPHSGATPPLARDACFDPDFVEGFQTAGDNRIIVTTTRNQPYELTLGGICTGLDTTFAVGIRSRNGMSMVCGPFDADIVFRDMGGMSRVQACPIMQVRHLTGEEAEKYAPQRKSDKK